LTGGGAVATLKVSEGAGMGEFDTSTIDGLILIVFRGQPDGTWRFATDMRNSDRS
jgi:hypothetical protein